MYLAKDSFSVLPEKKLEAQQLPWYCGCFHGKCPAASCLYFPGLFKWNRERNHFKEETQLKKSFHVDCWSNQQS